MPTGFQLVEKVFSLFCLGAKRLKIFKIQGHAPWILPAADHADPQGNRSGVPEGDHFW